MTPEVSPAEVPRKATPVCAGPTMTADGDFPCNGALSRKVGGSALTEGASAAGSHSLRHAEAGA